MVDKIIMSKKIKTLERPYRKTMKRDEWSRVLEKEVIIKDFEYDNFKGKISLLKMLKVSAPLYVKNGNKELKIADENISWVQIAFENQFFWITLMYDENGEFFDMYVDMTDGNNINEENPYFVDMYLDYELFGDKVLELDRAELDEALCCEYITQAQYDRTISEGKKVFDYLNKNKKELKRVAQDIFNNLKN